MKPASPGSPPLAFTPGGVAPNAALSDSIFFPHPGVGEPTTAADSVIFTGVNPLGPGPAGDGDGDGRGDAAAGGGVPETIRSLSCFCAEARSNEPSFRDSSSRRPNSTWSAVAGGAGVATGVEGGAAGRGVAGAGLIAAAPRGSQS